MNYSSHAKINIFLDVISIKSNGYHGIRSLFSEVDLCDRIVCEKNDLGLIRIIDQKNILPEDNLLKKASEKFIDHIKELPFGVDFHIEKNIPIGGGMGGGSSNAAAVLKILNEIWGANLSDKTIEKIGSKIGSDVPFFVKGGIQEVYGTGEKLKKIKTDFDGFKMIMIIPTFSVSTKIAYGLIDKAGIAVNQMDNEKKYKNIISGFKHNDHEKIIDNIYNKFEEVIFRENKELGEIKQDVINTKARISFMSGSGSTMIGIYDNTAEMEGGLEQLCKKGYNCRQIMLKFK
jgi:4-diphosphocytidyl-2-C-methyl-D-erythritol kinase